MWRWLASFLTGPIIGAAIDAYKAKLAAGNDADRIAADLASQALATEIKMREVERALLVAEQGNWFTRWVRPMWAAPFVIYTWKIVVYDICLGLGTTDPIRGDLATLMLSVSVAYFGGRSLETVVRTIWKR